MFLEIKLKLSDIDNIVNVKTQKTQINRTMFVDCIFYIQV